MKYSPQKMVTLGAVLSLLVLTSPITQAANTHTPAFNLIASTELHKTIIGLSAKDEILDKNVYNEKNEKVGEIEDLIISPDMSVTYAILEVGGFLGVGRHYVAVSVNYFKKQGSTIYLNGASKELLKQMPEYKSTK